MPPALCSAVLGVQPRFGQGRLPRGSGLPGVQFVSRSLPKHPRPGSLCKSPVGSQSDLLSPVLVTAGTGCGLSGFLTVPVLSCAMAKFLFFLSSLSFFSSLSSFIFLPFFPSCLRACLSFLSFFPYCPSFSFPYYSSFSFPFSSFSSFFPSKLSAPQKFRKCLKGITLKDPAFRGCSGI